MWEYLRLTRSISVRAAADDEGGADSSLESTIRVFRFGAKVEVKPPETRVFEMLEALGREGWELVSETIYDTALLPNQRGWPHVGTPAQIVMTFKRPRLTQRDHGSPSTRDSESESTTDLDA